MTNSSKISRLKNYSYYIDMAFQYVWREKSKIKFNSLGKESDAKFSAGANHLKITCKSREIIF